MRLRDTILCVFVLGTIATGCRCKENTFAPETPLVSQVKAALAERERKVQSFRFSSETEQAGQKAEYTFAFRAPNKMRGDIGGKVIYAYDGKRFVQFDQANGYFNEIDLAAEPRDKAQMFLHRVFSPFAPEGWRAPLLGGKLTCEQKAEGGKPRIAVTAEVSSDGEAVALTYLFAPPAMDFVGKSVRGGGSIEVLEQHCDAALKLCFPSVVTETPPAGAKATTRLSNIELNVPVPPEYFSPQAPTGVEVMKRKLP